jgi:hypothetical protein
MKQHDDNCVEIENSLALYVGGDLEDQAANEVRRHLERCSACAEREGAARASRDLMVSALVMSERKGPELWPGVRAGLVREGILVPPPAVAAPFGGARAPRRLRLLPYAAAAAALVAGVWLARDAFRAPQPFGAGPDCPAGETLVENIEIAPVTPRVLPTLPVSANADALHRVGRTERRLREGAEIYSDLPWDQALGLSDERTSAPVILRH